MAEFALPEADLPTLNHWNLVYCFKKKASKNLEIEMMAAPAAPAAGYIFIRSWSGSKISKSVWDSAPVSTSIS